MATRLAKAGPLGGAHTSGIFADMTVDGPEIGTLVVVFDRAKNLPNRRSMGKQDPYCAARLGKEAKKTSTDRRGGQTPKWDQELRFTVHDSIDYQTLKVSIFNDDKKTELIGEAFINLQDVIIRGGGKNDIWHQLNCKGRYAGEVRIEMTYYDSRPKPELPTETRRESARPTADSKQPSANGPREITPVKRRPLPSNPVTGAPAPVPLERSVPAPSPGPRSQEAASHHQPAHYARPTESSKRHTYYDPPTQQPVERRQVPEPVTRMQMHAESRNSYRPPIHQQTDELYLPSEESAYQPTPQRSHTRDSYPMQTHDSTPPVPSHSSSGAVSHMHSEYSTPSHSSRPRPQNYVELPHAHSAPVVPTTHDRRSMYHAHSEDFLHRQSLPQVEEHTQFEHSSHESASHNPYYRNEDEPQWANGYQDVMEQNPFSSSNTSFSNLQPTVEDELDVPPPPPVHRSSVPPVFQDEQQLQLRRYSRGVSPAPLRVTPSRDEIRHDVHASSPLDRNDVYDRRFTQPHELSSSISEMPSSLAAAHGRSSNLESAARTQEQLVNTREIPASYSPQVQSMHSSPYDTPVHQRHASQQNFQTPPNYSTPPRHPLAHGENVRHQELYHSAPAADPHAPHHSPYDATPLIKPRAVSPAMPSDTRPGREVARVRPMRKSVSPRPPVEQERRLSNVPFGPDDFDAFNPSSSPSHRASGTMASNEQEGKISGGPIIGFDGREIDPSDHLPPDSYAPEPERKGLVKITPTRERERLTGARGIGRRDPGGMAGSSPNAMDGLDLSTTTSGGRNRLHKPPPHSHSSAPNSAPSGGHRGEMVLHTQYSPSPYSVGMRRDAGNRMPPQQGPPIPAKIPLGQADDLARLSEEMSRIDIGAGNGTWRRQPQRGPGRGRY